MAEQGGLPGRRGGAAVAVALFVLVAVLAVTPVTSSGESALGRARGCGGVEGAAYLHGAAALHGTQRCGLLTVVRFCASMQPSHAAGSPCVFCAARGTSRPEQKNAVRNLN